MSDELEPIVGKWYLDAEVDEQFRVVAIDEQRDVVKIRYLNGEAEEIEREAWSDLEIEAAEPPEEASEDEDADPAASPWTERTERDAGEADGWEEDDDDEDEDDDDWDDEDEDDDQYDSE